MSALAFALDSPAATDDLGRRLGELLFPGAVVALTGELGAGKTRLCRAICAGLGVRNLAAVNSPTYVLIQEYRGRVPVYHFDAYRLTTPREFAELGADEYFAAGGVCLIEWADRVIEHLPAGRLTLALAHAGADRRTLTATAAGAGHEAVLATLGSSEPRP